MDNELGARIRALRKERGLSQEALAQALEVSRQAVTKWEDGSSLPSTANLFALAGFFSVPLAELTGTPESTSPAPPAASVSEKERRTRTKVLTIGACVLLAVSVPVLLWGAVQYFTAGPPIPEGMNYATGPVADCEAIIGYAGHSDRDLCRKQIPHLAVFERGIALCRGGRRAVRLAI